MNSDVIKSTYPEELYRISEKLTVVLARPWESLSPEEITLLSKILASVKESLFSVRMMNQPEINTSTLPPGSKIISFGSKVSPSVEPYACHWNDTSFIISADWLSELDDAKKKNLWTALRVAFNR
jgi:hypothetical protein